MAYSELENRLNFAQNHIQTAFRMRHESNLYCHKLHLLLVVQNMKSMFFLLSPIIWNFKNLYESLNKLSLVSV